MVLRNLDEIMEAVEVAEESTECQYSIYIKSKNERYCTIIPCTAMFMDECRYQVPSIEPIQVGKKFGYAWKCRIGDVSGQVL